jgi:F-type H+-transporting ATPase subunit alpha
MTDIVKIEQFLNQDRVRENMVLIATSPQDSAGEIFLCPYTAMTVAEYFRDKGRDVLVVYDDLTAHAEFYRELSLLMKKFPGRESYPGDIFYAHSKLLERAGNFRIITSEGEKEVSISCLPVAELVQGEIGGYIQTNLMSMTDGHIYFDYDLYFKGRRPAINPFLSVTRVGHQTQSVLQRDLNRVTLEVLNNYDKTQGFLKFGAELGENSRQILALGDRVLGLFNQPQFCMVPIEVQIFILAMILAGIWDGKDIEKIVNKFETDVDYRNLILGLISGCETTEQLMTKLRPQSDILAKYLN